MLLKTFEENWTKIQRIGSEAEQRGKALGMKLLWPEDEPDAKKSEPKAKVPRHRIHLGAEKR